MYTGDFTNNKTLEAFHTDVVKRYEKAHGKDYTDYLDKIKELASESASYRELGTMQGASLSAALVGNPDLEYLHCIDINLSRIAPHQYIFDDYNVEFTKGNSANRQLKLQPVDLLLIDSKHTALHLKQELMFHPKCVNKYIILHDTFTIKSLRKEIDNFVKYNKDWELINHYETNVGYSVIKRTLENE